MNHHSTYEIGRDLVRARDRKTLSKRKPRWWQKVRYIGEGFMDDFREDTNSKEYWTG